MSHAVHKLSIIVMKSFLMCVDETLPRFSSVVSPVDSYRTPPNAGTLEGLTNP